MTDLTVKRAYKNKMMGKQDQPDLLYGVLGNGQGALYPAGRENYVYAQIGFQTMEIYNVRIEPVYGLPVVIGVDPTDAQRGNQVLDIAGSQAQYAGIKLNGSGFAPAIRYQWMANGGGEDPLFVALRQFLPLRVSPAGGMTVSIYPGMIKLASGWMLKPFEVVDLSSYVPTNPGKALMALVYIDTSGSVGMELGSEADIADITTFYHTPVTPSNALYELAFVRLYNGQTALREGRVNSDLFEARLPYMVVLTNEMVGLGNVTNDAQLKRSAGDFDTFPLKTAPIGADVGILEDSELVAISTSLM